MEIHYFPLLFLALIIHVTTLAECYDVASPVAVFNCPMLFIDHKQRTCSGLCRVKVERYRAVC